MKLRKEVGLTFDDVLLVPQKSDVSSRSLVNTQTRVSKNVKLNIPMVSMNMATVTEAEMAIAMAREGGIGVIHRFMPVEEQADEVRKVKKSIGKVIENPIATHKNLKLKDAISLMDGNNITSLLIVDESKKLIGILTARDFIFEKDWEKPISEFMTGKDKLITGSPGIELEDAKKILYKNRLEKLPLIDSEGHVKGLVATDSIQHLEEFSNACRDEKGRLRVGAAIGIKEGYLERAEALVEAEVDYLNLDVAHGHNKSAVDALKKLKSKFDVDVVAGQIATAQAAKDLIKAGADGVRVGIGNGTICTTRIQAGTGVPQLTAIKDVYSVAKKFDIPVVSEGGIATAGNFTKALAAGASVVVFGSIFAGCDETPGPIVYRNGKRFKHYHGSTSYTSNVMNEARNSKSKIRKFLKHAHVEGVESMVPYKGPASEVIDSFMKGLRSGMSYSNAKTMNEFHKNAEFVRITGAGLKESNAHDVDVQ